MSDDRKDLPPAGAPNFNERLRETLQTYLGTRGSKLDRGLTLRDLVDSRLVTLRAGYLAGSGGTGSPVAGPGPAVNVADEPDLTPPPTPEGFAVSAAISNIFIEHSAPLYPQGHGHARTIVYGATWPGVPAALPTFGTAIKITEFTGTVFARPTNPATTWHLWIKWQSVDGIESAAPAGGTNGLVAITGQDVSALVRALTGPGNPFTVLTADTVIGGVTFPAGTYSTQAFIRDAQITNAKIAELAVDDAKIANLVVSKLDAGSLKVGAFISSSNYVAGSQGFRINADGLAEFSSVVVRGTVFASAGQIGGNAIGSTGIQSPGYIQGSVGWRLDSSGALYAKSGQFSGSITGASGAFSGSLSGADITGTTGTFSGRLAAGTVDFASSVGTTQTHIGPQTLTLTVPSGMFRMTVTLFGGGGGGGGGATRNGGAGGGGGAGLLVTTSVNVTPGQTFTLTVGAGGAGGAAMDPPSGLAYPSAGSETRVSGVIASAGGAAGSILYTGRPSGTEGQTFDTYHGQNGFGALGGAGSTQLSVAGAPGGAASGGGGGVGTQATRADHPQPTNGGNGGPGRAVIEFFDPNGVVLKAPFDALKTELRNQGLTIS